MTKYIDLSRMIFFLAVLTLGGCGTITGNPSAQDDDDKGGGGDKRYANPPVIDVELGPFERLGLGLTNAGCSSLQNCSGGRAVSLVDSYNTLIQGIFKDFGEIDGSGNQAVYDRDGIRGTLEWDEAGNSKVKFCAGPEKLLSVDWTETGMDVIFDPQASPLDLPYTEKSVVRLNLDGLQNRFLVSGDGGSDIWGQFSGGQSQAKDFWELKPDEKGRLSFTGAYDWGPTNQALVADKWTYGYIDEDDVIYTFEAILHKDGTCAWVTGMDASHSDNPPPAEDISPPPPNEVGEIPTESPGLSKEFLKAPFCRTFEEGQAGAVDLRMAQATEVEPNEGYLEYVKQVKEEATVAFPEDMSCDD